MKCKLTRERIIISSLAAGGMLLGLLILIPGLIMYFDSAPHPGFFLTVNLCPVSGSNRTLWEAPPSLGSCPEIPAGSDPDSWSQRLPVLSTLLYPKYPYICEVYLPAGVSGKFQLVMDLNGVEIANSGDLDSERLAEQAAAAAEKERRSTAKQGAAAAREEVPTGDVHPKIFDVEGGEQVRVWRMGNYAMVNGDFPDGTASCPDQSNKGCKYIPFRSMRKYTVPLSTFSWSLDTDYPVNATTLRVTDVRVSDPAGSRGAVPEMWIEIDGEESQKQTVGLVLTWIGALLLDCSPGVAYYFLTRIKDPTRLRNASPI